jgi:hypothetical protein
MDGALSIAYHVQFPRLCNLYPTAKHELNPRPLWLCRQHMASATPLAPLDDVSFAFKKKEMEEPAASVECVDRPRLRR